MPLKWGGFSSQLSQPCNHRCNLSKPCGTSNHTPPGSRNIQDLVRQSCRKQKVFFAHHGWQAELWRGLFKEFMFNKNMTLRLKRRWKRKKTPYPRFCGHPLCRMLSYPTRNGSSPHLQTCLLRFVFSAFERTFLRPAKGAEMSCFPNFL